MAESTSTNPVAAPAKATAAFTSTQPPTAAEPDQSPQRHLLAGLMVVLLLIAIGYGIYRRRLSAKQNNFRRGT